MNGGAVEYLVVAGGGGGGERHSGGGGAGGMLTGILNNVTPGSYTITFRAGGGGTAVGGTSRGSRGNDSSAIGIRYLS